MESITAPGEVFPSLKDRCWSSPQSGHSRQSVQGRAAALQTSNNRELYFIKSIKDIKTSRYITAAWLTHLIVTYLANFVHETHQPSCCPCISCLDVLYGFYEIKLPVLWSLEGGHPSLYTLQTWKSSLPVSAKMLALCELNLLCLAGPFWAKRDLQKLAKHSLYEQIACAVYVDWVTTEWIFEKEFTKKWSIPAVDLAYTNISLYLLKMFILFIVSADRIYETLLKAV